LKFSGNLNRELVAAFPNASDLVKAPVISLLQRPRTGAAMFNLQAPRSFVEHQPQAFLFFCGELAII